MSRRALELLADLDLFDRTGRLLDLSGVPDSELQGRLETYHRVREEAIANEIRREASAPGQFSALISSVSATNAVIPLLPSALVYSRMFTDDPVFTLCTPSNEYTRATRPTFGFSAEPRFDRRWALNKLEYFSALAPLIRQGALSVLPISHLHRPPEQLPIFHSEDGFASAVPEHIRDFIHDSAVIKEVVIDRENGRMLTLDTPPAGPTRVIAVNFAGDHRLNPGRMYFLTDLQKIGEVDETTIRFEQRFDPDQPVAEADYLAWVKQSVNRTILNRLAEVSAEMQLADDLNASYLTESEFESSLFALPGEEKPPADSRAAAVNFLKANAPFLAIGSPETVANVRGDNLLLFEKFHASLLHIASQLTDAGANFEDKAKQLYMKEVEPQVEAINAQFAKARYQSAGSAALAAATAALALLKLPSLPFAASVLLLGAGALCQTVGATLPSIGEYRQKRKGPAFIWSQLVKK